MDVFIGVDLGQLNDFTAAAVLERSLTLGPSGWPERNSLGFPLYTFTCVAIKRYELGTPYARITDHVVSQLKRPEMGPSPRVVLDATGVGIGVEEMFRSALSGRDYACHAISITAGRVWSVVARHRYHVSKVHVVGELRSVLEAGRLRVPRNLDHAATLGRELSNFRVKLTDAGAETFSAREGQHDDLVLSIALPVWLASQRFMELVIDPDGPQPHQIPPNADRRLRIEAMEREAVWLEQQKISKQQWDESRNPNLRWERERREAEEGKAAAEGWTGPWFEDPALWHTF
jgi:hypothetical protein